MGLDDLRPLPLFESLSDAQLGQLLSAGEEVRFEPGVEVFHEGGHADCSWVLIDGVLEWSAARGERTRSSRGWTCPAAAATRAVDSLEGACQSLLASPGRLAHGEVTADDFGVLDRLRREITPHQELSDPLAIADREDALSSWLARHGILRDCSATGSSSSGSTAPTCRGSRPTPASSTRSGPTSSTTPSTP